MLVYVCIFYVAGIRKRLNAAPTKVILHIGKNKLQF